MRASSKASAQNPERLEELKAWEDKHPRLPEKLMHKAHWSQGAKDYCPAEEEWRVVVEPVRHAREMRRLEEHLK